LVNERLAVKVLMKSGSGILLERYWSIGKLNWSMGWQNSVDEPLSKAYHGEVKFCASLGSFSAFFLSRYFLR
jgi:hypothetical protein